MNPEFKVLTNANESNLRTPTIQNRFRKLTLQSPKQFNVQPKLPEHVVLPQSKLAKENVEKPLASPYKSQTITNKLMLSTSSGNNTEQTNFINVETEPFTNPLQVENTENEPFTMQAEKKNESPKNTSQKSGNSELASQMENLDVSRVSVDLFTQFSTSSKISLPPNRILSNKENIENLSQRISNIHMSDPDELAETQPNTASQFIGELEHSLADTQPNGTLIVLSSDGEDDDNDINNESLLTEESEEDSVIELLSSDSSISEVTLDRIPKDMSAINTHVEELTESVEQKLNNFFENIPKLDASSNNYRNKFDSDDSAINGNASHSSINISETIPSEDCEENSALELQASHLDENLDKSGRVSNNKDTSHATSNGVDDNQKNETSNTVSDKCDKSSSQRSLIDGGSETSKVDNDSESQSAENASSDLNQSTDEKQVSVHEAKKKIEFEKIRSSATKLLTVNSPIINISARVNINIQLSGFSSNSSETDGTSENTDEHSEQSSAINESVSETGRNSPAERCAAQFAKTEVDHISESICKNLYVSSPNHKSPADDFNSDPYQQNDDISPDVSVIESSIIISSCGSKNRGKRSPAVYTSKASDDFVMKDSNSSVEVDTAKESNSSVDMESKSNSSVDMAKEPILVGPDTMKPDENDVSVSPIDSSVEIDEIGERLLTEIYGDTWRTPQLIKKCMSTKKKHLTDVTKRDKSIRFSLFQRDIPSELESTRITPSGRGKRSKRRLDSSPNKPLVSPNREVNKSDANQSSKILRSCRRKVPANRILDYSNDSDDDADGGESANSSFEPISLSDSAEESDRSWEKSKKPNPSKRNKFVYLDLTYQEVVEDEDHEKPDASPDELERVGNSFLQSLETQTIVQTPAPTKKQVPPITTRRKLFTPNYDDQIPFEQIKTPEQPKENKNPFIELKTPIPSFLIPPQFRNRLTPRNDTKKIQTPRTPAPSPVCGFLESLDDKLIPVQHCDPDALKFRTKFKQNRDELVRRLMKIFNEFVFDNKLTNLPVHWNKTLRKTAGLCSYRKKSGVRIAFIKLSEKVLTSADRVRDTLIHELCHAATWIIDNDSGHGKIWKQWAERANKKFPELPEIKRCHNYDIAYKYTYKCTMCGLKSQSHSNSKKVENIRCAACHGPIELFLNQRDKDGKVTLVPPKEPSIFARFVKENYKFHKKPLVSHAVVMKILSDNFGKLTVQEKIQYKN